MSRTPIKQALLSVSDKTGLVDFAKALSDNGVKLLSTGGTAKAIRTAGIPVTDVSEYTGSPEIMDGRVKTLHPRVHGGILMRDIQEDRDQLAQIGGEPIDLVVVNLYPFAATVAKGADFDTCVENIDIGGPTMVRASAKNHARVSIVVNPEDYAGIVDSLPEGGPSAEMRAMLAMKAFTHTAEYDAMISSWMQAEVAGLKPIPLKYGCNPHQNIANISGIDGKPLPFKILNGTPGYINLLDAMNSWQLVRELRQVLNLPASASFKHCSPAGAAVSVPLSEVEIAAYELQGKELTPAALAYVRARQADPMCSFGDFAALSDVVDEATAMVLKTEVSDGIIAPGYEPAALEILSSKKGGKYIVLQADPDFVPNDMEYRDIFGVKFGQKRATEAVPASSLDKVVTSKDTLTEEAKRDLLLAQIAIKYTQSNSVGYARSGQMIGVGAGQQSRVDCVKLAGRKVDTWFLRQHPKVLALPFKAGVKRQDRINARVRYIEGDFTPTEKTNWLANFETEPEPLTAEEKATFLKELKDVALASDAFFPFRDSIDVASQRGVDFVVAAGGSVADEEVIAAANEYGMAMAFSGLRLFHH